MLSILEDLHNDVDTSEDNDDLYEDNNYVAYMRTSMM